MNVKHLICYAVNLPYEVGHPFFFCMNSHLWTEFVCDFISKPRVYAGYTPHGYDFQSVGSIQIFLWNEFIGGWTMAMSIGNNALKACIQLILGY